ncbi:MAG TPA: hypothetical protein PLZ36_12915, partial [Armatimonadota bacterium]|nr:hypothetical protein [Armatimonadota bacterium]
VGRIARLQFTATPFEEALDTILGPEYSYTKTKRENGTTLYTIAGRNSGAARPTGGMVMNAPPADDPITPSASNLGTGAPAKTTGAGFPSLTYFTKPTTSTTGTTATGTPGTTTTEAATEELAVVKMIGINYLDLESICDALGGTSIALFNQGNYGGGTSGTGGTRSNRYNDNYNDPYYNNNNNSNNYNNNNYNDNYNTRNTRTTNTRNTRTSNRNYDY